MEQIVFGLIGLLAKLANGWNSLITAVEEFCAKPFAFTKLVETATTVMLWSVPIIFWTAVIRFVAKHW